jgi:hypothetical protein
MLKVFSVHLTKAYFDNGPYTQSPARSPSSECSTNHSGRRRRSVGRSVGRQTSMMLNSNTVHIRASVGILAATIRVHLMAVTNERSGLLVEGQCTHVHVSRNGPHTVNLSENNGSILAALGPARCRHPISYSPDFPAPNSYVFNLMFEFAQEAIIYDFDDEKVAYSPF